MLNRCQRDSCSSAFPSAMTGRRARRGSFQIPGLGSLSEWRRRAERNGPLARGNEHSRPKAGARWLESSYARLRQIFEAAPKHPSWTGGRATNLDRHKRPSIVSRPLVSKNDDCTQNRNVITCRNQVASGFGPCPIQPFIVTSNPKLRPSTRSRTNSCRRLSSAPARSLSGRADRP